jgi:hypothetical protein
MSRGYISKWNQENPNAFALARKKRVMEPTQDEETTGLTQIGEEWIASLRQFRPKLYRQLVQSGRLEAVALEAERVATERFLDWSGPEMRMSPIIARSEAIRSILLPSERDEKNLTRETLEAIGFNL